MFEDLTARLDQVFRNLRGIGKLSESNIRESLQDIRRVLLDADVNVQVARDFLGRVEERAIGQEVVKSVLPAQLIVKIVYDELVLLLGEKESRLVSAQTPPTVFMVVGLQGSGKTTFCAKLARHLKTKGKRPLLVAADLQRPAAQDQLQILGDSIGVPVFRGEGKDPVVVCDNALRHARKISVDPVILDTSGRLHVDDDLMNELERIQKLTKPAEILFVADGMTGQDAVNSARAFHERLQFSGSVLTKMDGDTRGGAALSIRAVTGKPLKFVSAGEKLEALEPFHPDRMAGRILGKGDIVTFVEKAQQVVDEEKAAKLEEKLRHADFTLTDFLDQLRQLKKMGSLESLLGMIPGVGQQLRNVQVDEKGLKHLEALILSMTVEERERPDILNARRRRRIAMGAGLTVQHVNRLIQQYDQMVHMMKKLRKAGPGQLRRVLSGR
ncbi:signal recognition particle protein [candidate division KSB1 bacterium]|nr:MAG: signal recognition particle protein [candidate division KSB1 bacterium]RPH97009.1 MAG: signal recognition particle protein [candidate division KSB1 bacterium]